MTTDMDGAEELSAGGDEAEMLAPVAEDEVTDEDLSPVLPATCLGSVLNFLPYSDVRTSLLAGKAVLIDAAKHVEVLSIFNVSGLDAPAARRFPNITEVNIFCLFRISEEDGAGHVISHDDATRVVPFLTIFPELKRAFEGGWCDDENDRLEYVSIEPFPILRNLIEAFCGAFRARILSQDLDLKGVIGGDDPDENRFECDPFMEAADSPCMFCSNICTNFPLPVVAKLYGPQGIPGQTCLSNADRINIMRNRLGGRLSSNQKMQWQCC